MASQRTAYPQQLIHLVAFLDEDHVRKQTHRLSLLRICIGVRDLWLGTHGVNIQLISTSEIKVSVVIEEEHTESAVRALHAAFLEAGADEPRSEA